jgi:hypothetical protein
VRYAKGWSIPQLSKRSGVPGRLIKEMESGSGTLSGFHQR